MSLEVIVKGQGRGLCRTLVIQRELDKDVIRPWGFNHLQGQQNQPAESGSSENRRKLQIRFLLSSSQQPFEVAATIIIPIL